MNESADWWGAMNEQMRKYAGSRNTPTKVADESDISESKKAATSIPKAAGSLPVSNPEAEILKRPAVVPPPAAISPPLEGNLNKAAPLPARTLQNQPIKPSIQPIPNSASVAPSIPNYSAAEISPEAENISKLSLAEQMELKLQAKTTTSANPEMIDIPRFDADPIANKQPQVSSNPWDTFEGDNNPGW